MRRIEPKQVWLDAALAVSRDYADSSRAGGWIISTSKILS